MKEFEEDDPMELQAIGITGVDPEFHALTVIDEFLIMGMAAEDLFHLFQEPFYQGTYQLYQQLGEKRIRDLITGRS